MKRLNFFIVAIFAISCLVVSTEAHADADPVIKVEGQAEAIGFPRDTASSKDVKFVVTENGVVKSGVTVTFAVTGKGVIAPTSAVSDTTGAVSTTVKSSDFGGSDESITVTATYTDKSAAKSVTARGLVVTTVIVPDARPQADKIYNDHPSWKQLSFTGTVKDNTGTAAIGTMQLSATHGVLSSPALTLNAFGEVSFNITGSSSVTVKSGYVYGSIGPANNSVQGLAQVYRFSRPLYIVASNQGGSKKGEFVGSSVSVKDYFGDGYPNINVRFTGSIPADKQWVYGDTNLPTTLTDGSVSPSSPFVSTSPGPGSYQAHAGDAVSPTMPFTVKNVSSGTTVTLTAAEKTDLENRLQNANLSFSLAKDSNSLSLTGQYQIATATTPGSLEWKLAASVKF